MKTCVKCGTSKANEQFHRHRESKDGRVNRCKECVATHAKKYRTENLVKLREYNRTYRTNNPAKMRYWKYGITADEFDALLMKHNGACHLCLKPLRIGQWTHVDHCHTTGVIRGVLCRPCNVALGALGDDETGLKRALDYVRGELPA